MALRWDIIWAVLYYIALPLIWILRLVWALVLLVSTPIIHVLSYLVDGLLLPIRFLARFETLFIYLGWAVLVGALTGLALHFLLRRISSVLGLDGLVEEETQRSMTSYRAGRAQKKTQHMPGLVANVRPKKPSQTLIIENSDLSKKEGPRSPIGLMSTTILEEDDTSGTDFG